MAHSDRVTIVDGQVVRVSLDESQTNGESLSSMTSNITSSVQSNVPSFLSSKIEIAGHRIATIWVIIGILLIVLFFGLRFILFAVLFSFIIYAFKHFFNEANAASANANHNVHSEGQILGSDNNV